jgi:hypothetical protein
MDLANLAKTPEVVLPVSTSESPTRRSLFSGMTNSDRLGTDPYYPAHIYLYFQFLLISDLSRSSDLITSAA